MNNEFSIYQFYPGGHYDCVEQFINAEDAVRLAHHYCTCVAGRLGWVSRVIITDGGDCIVWEWQHDKGVTFPGI